MAGAGFKDFVAGEVLTANDVDTYLMQQSLMVFADATARDAAITSPSEGMFAFLTGTDLLTYYDGSAWQEFTSGGGGVTISPTAPTDPDEGDLWWDSDDGKMFVYYNDGDSSQWVDAAGPSVAVQSTAPTGYEGQLWLDDTDGSMYVYYTDPGGGASSWIGAVSRSGGILQVVSTTKTDTFQSSATSWTDVTGLEVSITPRSTSSKILVTASVAASPDNADNAGMSLKLVGGNTSGYVGDAAGSRQQGVYGMFNDTATANLYLSLLSFSFEYLDSPSSTSTQTYKIQMITDGAGAASINRSTGDGDSVEYTRGASTITVMEIAG